MALSLQDPLGRDFPTFMAQVADDTFGYWREGEAYKTPADTGPALPLCAVCGSRHEGRVPWCTEAASIQEEDEADV